MLAIFSDQTLIVPKSTVLGIAEEASEPLIHRINQRKEPNSDSPLTPQRKKKNEALYRKLLNGKLDHLNQEDRELIEQILLKYAHVFHDEETNDFKGTNVIEHEIPIGDARPIRRPQYRTPYALRKEMQTQVENMLDKGVIRPSNSPWLAPAILVPKKSADGTPKYRFTLYKIIILPERISPDKFVQYAIDYLYLAIQVSQHGYIPFTEKDHSKCVTSNITVCPLDSAIFNTQRLACAASLFFQSPNSQQLCKRNLLSTIDDDAAPEHLDISLPNATATDSTLPGERSQSSRHTSTRERRTTNQRISLPCVHKGFAYISYATRIYADGT